ncbi:hypothetical protein RND81_04G094900 [Saponaria officinalis]|uniref:No apical meristem-associated C-terminal domain-containing protein n=1 Tax=Saponaria officinalis TaxID=3572 RepID=A0AAW1LMI6_SAPOF
MSIYNYAGFYPCPSGYGVTDNYSPGSNVTKTKGTVNLEENISSSEQESGSPVPPYSTQEGLDNITVNVEGSKREKWTTIEDKALIEAWVTISTDASVGNDQNDGAFWQRVTNYFNRYNKGKTKRTLDQLKARYHRTQPDINGFNEIYNRISNQYLSGWSEDQKKQAAREEWKASKNGRHFTLEHMWEISKDYVKWNSARDEDKSEQSTGSKRSSSNAESEVETRPMGRKAAKLRKNGKAKGKQYEEELLDDEFINFSIYQKEKLDFLKEIKEQIQSTYMAEELAILNTDTSGMTADAKEVHQLMCKKIRSKYE